jgi:hypothetical protein
MTQQPPPGSYQPAPQGQPPGPAPSNHLVLGILVVIFCALPGIVCGIVSIVKATQVNGLWAQGQYAAAQQSANSAKKWAIWGAIIGLIFIVVVTVPNVIDAMNQVNNQS